MNLPPPIRVIGCGGAVGDDALAAEVIRRLRACLAPDPRVELHVVAGGQDILDLLDARGTLLLIDAVSSGAPPGTIHRLEWPDERLKTLRPGTTHDLRPAEALRLAAALGRLPERVVIFGLEAGDLSPRNELSEAVTTVLPELVARIGEFIATG